MRTGRFIHISASLIVLVLCLVDCTDKTEGGSHERGDVSRCRRIVSLAPSITETLFALGLGGRVVGVTRYCRYPAQAQSIEKIGGYTDANLERIVSLNPDIVILQPEHEKQRSFLGRYGIETLRVAYRSMTEICTSFARIGHICGAGERADSLIAIFDSALTAVAPSEDRPRVLLCVGRERPGSGSVQSVYAAGAGTFYHDLILAAGARNAFSDSIPRYPRVSLEGLVTVAPEVIVDIAPAMGGYACSTLAADWDSIEEIPAVRAGNLFCLAADYATLPGPRALVLLEDLRVLLRKAGY